MSAFNGIIKHLKYETMQSTDIHVWVIKLLFLHTAAFNQIFTTLMHFLNLHVLATIFTSFTENLKAWLKNNNSSKCYIFNFVRLLCLSVALSLSLSLSLSISLHLFCFSLYVREEKIYDIFNGMVCALCFLYVLPLICCGFEKQPSEWFNC